MVGPGPTALGPVRQRCDLCELHPGDADGMEWSEMVATFGVPDWDRDPTAADRPGGESWAGFVERASGAVREIVRDHPGELVVAAVHAGVIEATMIAFLGVSPEVYRRGWVRIVHASMTEWEWVPSEDRFVLLRFNDSAGVPRSRARAGRAQVPSRKVRARASGAQASQASSIASRRGFLVTVRSCTRTAA